MKKRIIFSNNGVLSDITPELNNYYSGNHAFSYVAAEDKIFIGSTLPFNHLKINLGAVVNEEISEMNIKIWDGKSFESVVEVIDETSISGATLAQSGFIEFVPSKNTPWVRDDTVGSSGNQTVTGLGDVEIYDKYWLELSFSADLTADVEIDWIGQIFSNDSDLTSEFPDFAISDMKSAFKSGKTDWAEQHYVAANMIIKDLKSANIISDKNQILCREDLVLASVQKTAMIIYNALGDDYLDQTAAADKEYRDRIKKANTIVDVNADGRVGNNELRPFNGNFVR